MGRATMKSAVTARRLTARFALSAVIAGVALIATERQTVAQETLPLVNSLIYLGKFFIPTGQSGSSQLYDSFSYGGSAVGYNPVNNSLFIVGHVNEQLLAEISIPAIGGTATILQNLKDPTGGRLPQINPQDPNSKRMGGTLVSGSNLIVSAYSYYDGLGSQELTHFVRPKNLSDSTVTGPLQVGSMPFCTDLNSSRRCGGFFSGYMGVVPSEWQAALGGPALTGNGSLGVISRTSFGPAIFAFDPNNISPTGAVPLLYYPEQNRTLGNYEGASIYWGGSDTIRGVAVIPGTSTIAFFGRHGETYCYGWGTNDPALDGQPNPGQLDPFCYDPTDGAKGVHGYPYNSFVWLYNLNDLAAVRAGTLNPWSVLPYNTLKLTSTMGPQVGGAAIDPATGRIYIIEQFAAGTKDGAMPVVHVYQANMPPSVTITSPPAGATFTAPASVTISADATDTTGTVASVAFYAGSTLLGTDTTSPFSITSPGMPAGNYSLTAKATDNLGVTATSAPVSITVFSTATPSVTLSGSNLAFAKQRVGTTSAASQSVTITNNGPGALAFASFNGAAPSSSFTVGGGDFQVQTDCPLTPAGLAPAAFCTFTFRFSPTAAGARAASLSIGSNALGSPHAIGLSGTAFVVDEPTVSQTIANGGTRQRGLQVADGGWYFRATDTQCGLGPGVSCGNTIGVTALSLLSAYDRNGDPATLNAAVAAGTRLLAVYNAAPTLPPFSQDLEFLVALTAATADPQYATTAATWFQTIPAAFPNAADRVDWSFTRRNGQGIRTLAVWDLASLIRTAKAVGAADYALAAAVRIRDREADWKDINPADRWDQCPNPAGCGPADNPRAFDYTLLGMGSLLWAIHDLPGFDAQFTAYRAHLLSQQDAAGSWDAGNLQITSYVVMGLGALGGSGTDAAIQSAVAFFIANQLPSNGWPFTVTNGVAGPEYSTVNAEVMRAVATLFSTPSGQSVQVAPAQLSTVTFSTVTTSGATTVVARQDASAAKVPAGYTLVSGLSYEVATSAIVNGYMTVCVAIPWAATADPAADIRLLHREHGHLRDRTIRQGPLAPTSTQVCAAVTSLDGFAVALRQPRH